MSRVLEGIEPNKVFKYFEEISAIPRASYNELEITDYLIKFANDRGLEVIRDKYLNIIIKKPASKGYENVPTIVIQGHTDMVCEKNQDTDHDFEKEGIKLQVKGDFVSAIGTTLGSDNGIGVAFALALLDSDDLGHPALEILLTSDEEHGMDGARYLDPELIKGRYLINLDAEEEGHMYVGCAGGFRGTINIPINRENLNPVNTIFHIKVRGLVGGHSGFDIHLQRGNSNKLLGRFLNKLYNEVGFKLISISGGVKDNAIPREADAIIEIDSSKVEIAEKLAKEYTEIYKQEYTKADFAVNIFCEKLSETQHTRVLTNEASKKVISLLFLHANGVQRISEEIAGIVETSLNVGVIKTTEEYVQVISIIRSSVDSTQTLLLDEMKELADVLGVEFTDSDHYPTWHYRCQSQLREHMKSVYKKLTNNEMEIKGTHAGLECGFFDEKYDNIDIVAIGPNIYGAHTPEEKMSISSVQNVWEYFVKTLEEMNNIKWDTNIKKEHCSIV